MCFNILQKNNLRKKPYNIIEIAKLIRINYYLDRNRTR